MTCKRGPSSIRNLTGLPLDNLLASSCFNYGEDEKATRLFKARTGAQKGDKPPGSLNFRLYELDKKTFVFLERDLSSWMSGISDKVRLNDMCIPGTHETMAAYGWPISQCQERSTPLATQLLAGIRMIDIRLSLIDGNLIAYHGIISQREPFPMMLSTLHSFLSTHPTETIIVSLKQENQFTPLFNSTLASDIENSEGGWDMWELQQDYIPTLGEARGKCVMFSRFAGTIDGWPIEKHGLGIHPYTWPDNSRDGFDWWCGETYVRTQDWYQMPSFLFIPEKAKAALDILTPPEPPLAAPLLNISFTSGSSVGLGFPPTIAKGFGWPNVGFGIEGVNVRVTRQLLRLLEEHDDLRGQCCDVPGSNQLPLLSGWVLMDFYDYPKDSCVPLLVEFNYRQLELH